MTGAGWLVIAVAALAVGYIAHQKALSDAGMDSGPQPSSTNYDTAGDPIGFPSGKLNNQSGNYSSGVNP